MQCHVVLCRDLLCCAAICCVVFYFVTRGVLRAVCCVVLWRAALCRGCHAQCVVLRAIGCGAVSRRGVMCGAQRVMLRAVSFVLFCFVLLCCVVLCCTDESSYDDELCGMHWCGSVVLYVVVRGDSHVRCCVFFSIWCM